MAQNRNGRARHSVRAVVRLAQSGAQGTDAPYPDARDGRRFKKVGSGFRAAKTPPASSGRSGLHGCTPRRTAQRAVHHLNQMFATSLAVAILLLASNRVTAAEPFFFIQLSDPQFGMFTANKGFAQETANFEFAGA